MPNSQYRLKSSAFERPEENHQIEPKRVIFLSVEGDCTEKDYFAGLNTALNSSIIQIEVLRHNEETDLFGVVIDRDHESHSRDVMLSCKEHCEDAGINFYVSNPCFEFWLLLHLCDISIEYGQAAQEKMLLNPKESAHHTFVSYEVSLRAHHAKNISIGKFKNTYLPNIHIAIERSKNFATQFPNLLDQLGTNVPDLLKEIGFPAL